ncbi:MAG: hypothetical protein EA385_08520 [Salinarimonadaceae bacterium]|nr:MAG: hypothetical protein EA385_08520 [Salinarimonadaceae bacterium]
MTEAVAGPANIAATSGSAVLHRSERGARLVGALDFALKAMREEARPDFAAQIEAAARAPASAPAAAPPAVAAPTAPTPSVVISAQASLAEAPALALPDDGPLDIMRWSKGVAPPDEMAELAATLDEDRPKPVAPDIAALSRAEENHMPRDVLEVLRERHLGMTRGGDVR